MKIKVFHNRKNVFYLETIVFFLISIVYVFIIKDVYGYMGFEGEILTSNVLLGLCFFFPMLYLGSKIREDFFFAIWHMMFILYFFGQVIYFQYSNSSLKPVIANTIFLIILYLFSLFKLNFTVFKVKGKQLAIVIIVSLLLFIPIFIKYLPHINYRSLLLEDIYKTRLYFRDFDDQYFGYLRAPLSRVVLPSLLIIAIIKHKTWLILLAGFMIIFIFLVGALKSIFIGMFAAVLFYKGKNFIDKVYTLLYLFLGLTLFGIILYIISENTFLVNSFVRRILFIPPMLDNYYFKLFEDAPLLWSHNDIGSLFFDYPLDRPPNMYIGETILKKEGMSANVGLISEGFFSFNYLGVVLHSLFLGCLFVVLKQIKIRPVFFGILFVYIYYINTSFITVLLLTHGLFFFVIYAYFFLNKDYGEKNSTPIK